MEEKKSNGFWNGETEAENKYEFEPNFGETLD